MMHMTRRRFNWMMAGFPAALALKSAPAARGAIVRAISQTTMPKGPFEPTWESVSKH
jgi:hypothetical protein